MRRPGRQSSYDTLDAVTSTTVAGNTAISPACTIARYATAVRQSGASYCWRVLRGPDTPLPIPSPFPTIETEQALRGAPLTTMVSKTKSATASHLLTTREAV